MNKLCYRVIFNKTRGVLMVVSELAKSATSTDSSPQTHKGRRFSRVLSALTKIGFLTYLVFGFVHLAQASVMADQQADKSLRPAVTNTANGAIQVDIQTPTAAGVSRNHFSQFDVPEKGVILNNSRKTVSTETAGFVSGNPYLARGEARVILNEVNSAKASQLQGVVEVAGKNAHVIIANPSGIRCAGCGFINADRATLTTGQVQLKQGQVSGYDINQGTLTIDGQGLNNSRVNYTELLAQAVDVNAGIWAQDLQVVTGDNQINAEVSRIHPSRVNTPTSSRDSRTVALDVSALGGMYANQIHLVGTAEGMGVNNAGVVAAQVGQLRITTQGKLTNSGKLHSAEDLVVKASERIDNLGEGQLYSKQNIALTTPQQLYNEQTILAEKQLSLQAKAITNQKYLVSQHDNITLKATENIENQHIIDSAKALTMTTDANIINHKSIVAGNGVSLSSRDVINQGEIMNQQGQTTLNLTGSLINYKLQTGGHLTVTTAGALTSTGQLIAKEHVSIDSHAIHNQGVMGSEAGNVALNSRTAIVSQTLISGQELSVVAKDDIVNEKTLSSVQSMRLRSHRFRNLGEMATEAGDMVITVDDHVDNRGEIHSRQALTLQAGGVVRNQAETQMIAQQALNIKAGNLDNQGTLVNQQQAMSLAIDHDIHNHILSAGDTLNLHVGNKLTNTSLLVSTNNMQIEAGHIANNAVMGSENADVTLTSRGDVINQTLKAGRHLRLRAEGDVNSRNILVADGEMRVTSSSLLNYGVLSSQQDLHLQADNVVNKEVISSESGHITINSQRDIESKVLKADGNVSLHAHGRLQTSHSLVAKQDIAVTAQSVHNEGLLASHQGDIVIRAEGDVTNEHVVVSGGAMQLVVGGKLTNQHAMQAIHDLTVQAKAIFSQQMMAKGNISMAAHQQLETQQLQSEKAIQLASGDQIVNQHNITAQQAITLQAQRLKNEGVIESNGDVNLALTNSVDSQRIYGGQHVSITSQQGMLTNRDYVIAGQNLAIQTAKLDNQKVLATDNGRLTLTIADDWSNQHDNSDITSGGDLIVNASRGIRNDRPLSAKGYLALQGQHLENRALIIGEQGLAIKMEGDIANHHSLASSQALTIETHGRVTNHHIIASGGDSKVKAEHIDNRGEIHSEKGHLFLQGAQNITSTGLIKSGAQATLATAQEMMNKGRIYAADYLNLQAGNCVDNYQYIGAGNGVNISATQLMNHKEALLIAGVNDTFQPVTKGQLQVELSHELNNAGDIDGSVVWLQSGRLTNRGTGRIFGDLIGIKTGTLNNITEEGQHAVIAAREHLAIGAGVLNNLSHTLIYSQGDMVIGGDLNKDFNVSSTAKEVNNRSATMEAQGHLNIQAETINNLNDNIQTEIQEVSRTKIKEFQLKGSPERIASDKVVDHFQTIYTPYGESETFTRYVFDRIVRETRVIHSEPGKMSAGKDLTLFAGVIKNNHSVMSAGETLRLQATSLVNESVEGKRITQDVGDARSHKWKRRKKIKRIGRRKKSYSNDLHKYQPEPVIETIALSEARQLGGQGALLGRDVPNAQYVVGTQTHTVSTSSTQYSSHDMNKVAEDYEHGIANVKIDAVRVNDSGVTIQTATQPLFDSRSQITVGHRVPMALQAKVEPEADMILNLNQLFIENRQPNAKFRVESHPRFTQYGQWMSSDYMLQRLNLNPDVMLKRLGDGFYEQQLVKEQIISQTGLRYLRGHQQDQVQYQALLTAGVEFTDRYPLTVGVALTAEQMSQLTTPIVWLVEKRVKGSDGSIESVLFPQLYLPTNYNKVETVTGLLSGRQVYADVKQHLVNQGHIYAAENVGLMAGLMTQKSATITGDKVSLQAKQNITLEGSQIMTQRGVNIDAGQHLYLISELTSGKNHMSSHQLVGRQTKIDNAQGDMLLQAKGDVMLQAVSVINRDKAGKIALQGDNVQLDVLDTHQFQHLQFSGSDYLTQKETLQVGNRLESKGDILLFSERDTQIKGSHLKADEQLLVHAKRDLTVTAAEKTVDFEQHMEQTERGWTSKKKTVTHDMNKAQSAIVSELDGGKITLSAGNDMHVAAGKVIADQQLTLQAGHDLLIDSAKELSKLTMERHVTKKGIMSGGSFGFSIGKRSNKQENDTNSDLHKGSLLGSLQGDIDVKAGKAATILASELIAKGNIRVEGRDVTIKSGDDVIKTHDKYEYKQSGLSVGIGGTAEELYHAGNTIKSGREESDQRLAVLKTLKGSLGVVDSLQKSQLKDDKGQDGITLSVNIGVGTKKTRDEGKGEYHRVAESYLSAQKDIHVVARGGAEQGGDITIQGSQLRAEGTTSLSAARDVNILGAVNTNYEKRETTHSGGLIGLTIGLSEKSKGFSLNASGQFSQERERENGSAWTESVITGKEKVEVNAKRDTSLIGGELVGKRVEVDTGRNLLIRSQQDSDDYDYEKLSAAVDASYDLVSKAFDAGSTLTQTKMSSEYASVKEQSGIKAGAGGFGVKVGEKTTLAGGVISSSGDASTNRVETGRLEWSDIENRAAYSVSQVKLSGSLQGGMGKPEVYLDGDNSSSKTHSAVSAGTILIKDETQQQQALSDLRRDTINGHEVLAPIFDKERSQRRLEGVTLVKEIAEQTKQVLKNEARLSEQKRLEEAGWVSENGRTLNDEIDHRLKGSATGLGGSVDKAINMASSLVTGIISGNVTGGLAAGGAAYLATEIKNATLKRDDVGQIVYDSHGNPEQDKETALLLHGILGGIVGYLTSGEGVSGAVGAIAGEVAADALLKARYPTKEIGDLTEEEKRELSRLASLVGGLAGVIASQGDIAGAKAGLETAKNAVENNALSNQYGVEKLTPQDNALYEKLKPYIGEIDSLQEEFVKCSGESGCETKIRNQYFEAEAQAGKNFVALYESGQISKEEFDQFVTSYANSMMEGAAQGQKENKRRGLLGNIYDLSANSWTPAGQMGDPYLSAVRQLIIISELKAKGMSNEKIEEKLLKDSALGSVLTVGDHNKFVKMIDNGISPAQAMAVVAGGVLSKVTSNTGRNRVLNKEALEAQHGQGKVEQGGGKSLQTKETVHQNVVESRKGNNQGYLQHLEQAKINPATKKVVTEHVVVSSGKAPPTSTPNSIYEVSRADGTKSITYYDEKGRTFSREDYGQQKTHGQLGYDANGKVPPHEHKITYNERGFVDKRYYREIDQNGKPVGDWILDKK